MGPFLLRLQDRGVNGGGEDKVIWLETKCFFVCEVP